MDAHMWTVIRIPVSDMSKLRMPTSGPSAPFAVAVFGRPITAADIARLIGRG